MATEKRPDYDITFKEFGEWAASQSWLGVRSEGRELGMERHTFLTPTGTKLIVAVKDDRVVMITHDIFD